MLPIQRKISAFNYNKSNSIKYIVIHDVGAYGTAKNNVDYFYGGNRNASCHYFVDDLSIWQSVEDYHGAWHVGDGKGQYGITNSNSIGIEMCLPSKDVTELTENNTIELVKYLMTKYNVSLDRVVRHYDASRKSCPDTFRANNWARWNNFKVKLSGQQTSTPSPSPAPQPTVNSVFEKAKAYNTPKCSELQSKLNKCGFNCGSVDGIYGEKTHNALGNFQVANGLVKDYLAGNNTFAKLNEIIEKQNTTQTIKFNQKVKEIQEVCNKYGANLVVDGLYGTKTEAAIKNLPLAGLPYRTPELTKWIQKILGISQDGIFGANTDRKVKEYQKNNGLTVDGLVGFATIKSMLGL